MFRLEAEIEEARLKAQEEMMHGIQAAKEVAQKELSDQKMLYESKISALERELVWDLAHVWCHGGGVSALLRFTLPSLLPVYRRRRTKGRNARNLTISGWSAKWRNSRTPKYCWNRSCTSTGDEFSWRLRPHGRYQIIELLETA